MEEAEKKEEMAAEEKETAAAEAQVLGIGLAEAVRVRAA